MYGNMLLTILDNIEKSDGNLIYRTGSLCLSELQDIVLSDKFIDEINDSNTEKKISLHAFQAYYEKYDFFNFSAIISLDGNKFKLYIDRVQGCHKLSPFCNDEQWFETFKEDTINTFPGALVLNLNYIKKPLGPILEVQIELNGKNNYFPDFAYIEQKYEYFEKSKNPANDYYKILFGQISSEEDDITMRESIPWHILYVDKENQLALLVTQNMLKTHCSCDFEESLIDLTIKDTAYNTDIFQNYEKNMIKDIFIANESFLQQYTEDYKLYSERYADDELFLHVHLCCWIECNSPLID